MASRFDPKSAADIRRLIADYPLAWVISRDFQATPLPLVAQVDAHGAVECLIGHFARRNAQVAALQADPRALVLFQGPQGYISPRLVSRPAWAPTWNYAVTRFEVTIDFSLSETDDAVARLLRHVEGARQNPWKVEEMGARYNELRRHIIGFRAPVKSTYATFKLGQDEDDKTLSEIIAGLGDTPLSQWMSAQQA
jgi:transcriptional regulator